MKVLKKINNSYLIAAGIVVALALWLMSGYIAPGVENGREDRPSKTEERAGIVTVQVREKQAETVVREIVVQGYVEPNRAVTLRAETPAKVTEIVAKRGQRVKKGDIILRLQMDDRAARLKEAKALVRQRERDYEASKTLGQQGFQSKNKVQETLALLEKARAELRRIELEIANTVIRAPFNGILNERLVEIGDYVAAGSEIGKIVDDNPLIVIGQIPQQSIREIHLGNKGAVRLVTGQEAGGVIRYISATAERATRTFRVELEVTNPKGILPAGVSAEIRMPIQRLPAHFISPALLDLNPKGTLGVKTVNHDGRVEFHPVEIVRAETNGVWVSGLADQVRVITRGQGFVQPGERVEAVIEEEGEVRQSKGSAPDKPASQPLSETRQPRSRTHLPQGTSG